MPMMSRIVDPALSARVGVGGTGHALGEGRDPGMHGVGVEPYALAVARQNPGEAPVQETPHRLCLLGP